MSRMQKYAEETSFHGPGHFLEAKSIAEKTLWVILMLTAGSIALYQICVLMKEFRDQTIATSISNQMGKDVSNHFNFTYCPEDWLDITKIRDDNVDVLAFVYGLMYIPMVDFYPIRELDLLHCSKSNCSNFQDVQTTSNNTDTTIDTTVGLKDSPDTLPSSNYKSPNKPEISVEYELCKQSNSVIDTYSYDYLSAIVFNSNLHSKKSLEERLVQLMITANADTMQDLVLRYAKHLDVPESNGVPSQLVVRAGKVCHQSQLPSGRSGKVQFFYNHHGIIDGVEPGYLFSFHRTKDSSFPLKEPSAFTIARVRSLEYKFGATAAESPNSVFESGFERQQFYLSVQKYIHLSTSQNPCNTSNQNAAFASVVRLDSCVFEKLMSSQEKLKTVSNFFHSLQNQKIDEPFKPNAATFGKIGNLYKDELCKSYFDDSSIFLEQREICNHQQPNCYDTLMKVTKRNSDKWNPKWAEPIIKTIKNGNCTLETPCRFIRQVEFELTDFVIYSESLHMTAVQFVGNAGGLFGLYSGASLITFAHFLIYWARALCNKVEADKGSAKRDQPLEAMSNQASSL